LPRQAITAAPYALYASNAYLLKRTSLQFVVDIASAQTISGDKTFASG